MPHFHRKLLFLPGAGADPACWRPLGDRLPTDWAKHYLRWPGLGNQPADPHINSLDDLVGMVEQEVGNASADVLAQSMGGVVALKLAIRKPRAVRRLVLAVTSGGVDAARRSALQYDWRVTYRMIFPDAAAWIEEDQADLTAELSKVTCPTLLLFGDADPIAPPSVGHRLLELLPNARLHIVGGGDHDLIINHATEVAPLILEHLQ